MSIESLMPSNHLVLCHPLLLLPSIFPSIRVFSNELALRIRWPRYWNFSFSISPSNKYSGLISFRIDWFDLLAIQGTLKSLRQHLNSKSINSLALNLLYGPNVNLYMTTRKTITLFRPLLAKWCLCFSNMLSRFVIAFLSKIKHFSISWLQSPFTVILVPKNMKSATVSTFSPSIWH